jgi:hypothetical protein
LPVHEREPEFARSALKLAASSAVRGREAQERRVGKFPHPRITRRAGSGRILFALPVAP